MAKNVETEAPRVFESREEMLRAECPEGMKVYPVNIFHPDGSKEECLILYVFAKSSGGARSAVAKHCIEVEKSLTTSALLQMYRESFKEQS